MKTQTTEPKNSDLVLVQVNYNKSGAIRYIVPTYVYIPKDELESNQWRTIRICGTYLNNEQNETSNITISR